MPVRIASRTIYSGYASPSALNTETIVVDIPAQSEFYIVEGYIDLSALGAGDTVTITEYMSVDGVNLVPFLRVTYSGPVSEPVIRFHTKTFKNGYRVTITQTAGTLRQFPYWFIMELAEVV